MKRRVPRAVGFAAVRGHTWTHVDTRGHVDTHSMDQMNISVTHALSSARVCPEQPVESEDG